MLLQPTSDGIGEVCMWGRHVFMGYLEKQEETTEIIDEEGWLHSGDLGLMDNQGFLYITGRIKGTGARLCRGLLQTGPSEHLRGWQTSANTGLRSLSGMGRGWGGGRSGVGGITWIYRAILFCTSQFCPREQHLALRRTDLGKTPTPSLKPVSCPVI